LKLGQTYLQIARRLDDLPSAEFRPATAH
jgi:hypothetical protein